eukprot:TRINITY_DN2588_c0_g1_i3.p1 TRINITY_DN2588_c0_g1~~TRINITY_DN2588_c0_g1_i3.p1  ORF type:complete len:298 (-),score=54.09 TRINITY_DN2588_c0_g1_i3:37-930(-)
MEPVQDKAKDDDHEPAGFILPVGKGINLTLYGGSKAAHRTAFWIKELRIFLDAGMIGERNQRPTHVFLSHSHNDHSGQIKQMPTHRWAVEIFSPQSNVPFIANVLVASQELNDNAKIDPNTPEKYRKYILTGVKKNDVIFIKSKNLRVDIVECTHTVDCVGYCFSTSKKKLKEEFKDKAGNELRKIKEQGIELTEDVFEKRFVFLGDTTSQVFENHPELFTYPVIIVECTFIKPEHEKNVETTQHMHWNHLKKYIEDNPSVFFILIHWSARYSPAWIKSFFDPLPYPNMHLWLENTL